MALLAWAGLIFWASDQPDLRVSDDDLLDFVLRKCAHLAVFGTFAVLLARLLRGEGMRERTALGTAWVGTLLWAASDEWHQTFVAGRVGQPRDVIIDMAGASIALLVLRRSWRGSTAPISKDAPS